jgi:ATP-dependent RNA helicase SUPV3L1/SUV3
VLSAYGLRAVGGWAVPVEALEQLDELLRAGVKQGGGVILGDQATEALGWNEAEAHAILRALGFSPANRPKAGEPIAWRRRGVRADARPKPAVETPAHSPFAALAALQPAPPAAPVRRRPRRRKPRASRA